MDDEIHHVMIPFENAPTRATILTNVPMISGAFTIRIEALTPLCILHTSPPQIGSESTFAHLGGKPFVPATSLKGMLRSVHEIVTDSRMAVAKAPPPRYGPIKVGQQPSPSDALFGYSALGEQDAIGIPRALAGRILISDVGVAGLDSWTYAVPKPPQQQSQAPPTGRKVFCPYRSPNDFDYFTPQRGSRTVGLQGLRGFTEQGTIRFVNLVESELASLVYSLILEEDLVHKLGFGKGQGFGTVRIVVDRLEITTRPGGIAPLDHAFLEGDPLITRIAELRDAARDTWVSRPGGKTTYDQFREATTWKFAAEENP